MPTGPKFLSAVAMTILAFVLMEDNSCCWKGVRLNVEHFSWNEVEIAVVKWLMHVSILVGGSGGRHILSSSPAKKTLIPMSRSSFKMVCSMFVVIVVRVGFGMNLRSKLRRWWARGGRWSSVVRSWQASFLTGGKKEEGWVLARMCRALRWVEREGEGRKPK